MRRRELVTWNRGEADRRECATAHPGSHRSQFVAHVFIPHLSSSSGHQWVLFYVPQIQCWRRQPLRLTVGCSSQWAMEANAVVVGEPCVSLRGASWKQEHLSEASSVT